MTMQAEDSRRKRGLACDDHWPPATGRKHEVAQEPAQHKTPPKIAKNSYG